MSVGSSTGTATGAGTDGSGSSTGLGIFYGRPVGGGSGGIYERAINQQPVVPFAASVGSGQSSRDVSSAAFESLDSLIIRYVDNYFQSVTNRDAPGSSSFSITGSDDVGSYTFTGTASYNYQETGNPTSTFSLNDTDSMSYSFHETGVAPDGTSFTLNDHGSANSTSTIATSGSGGGGGGGGGHRGNAQPQLVTSGSYTLTNALSGFSSYTLIESTSQAGTLGSAGNTDGFSLQHIGSDTYALNELRTITADSSNDILSGQNVYTFSETDNDTWTSTSWSQNNGGGTITGGTELTTDSSSFTDSGSLHNSFTITATDSLTSYGSIASGNRSFTFGVALSDTDTVYEMDTDSDTLTGGGSSYVSDTLSSTESHTLSQYETGTETYAATSSYTWNETATDSLSSSESDYSTVNGSELDTSNLGGVTSSGTTRESQSEHSTLIETGPITQTLTQSGSETLTSETLSGGNSTDTWNETATFASTLSDTVSDASTTTMTNSYTLGGVTDSTTSTLTDSPQSTLTETGTDTLSFHETGSDTLSGDLIGAGTTSQTLVDTFSGGHVTGSEIENVSQTSTESTTSTLGGQTTSETDAVTVIQNSTDTPSSFDSSTSTLWNTESLSHGGVAVQSTDSDTLYDASSDTESLGVTTTETETDRLTESDSLGGVSTTESMTFTPTSTETDSQTITYHDTQTVSSSATTSLGAVTGGGQQDSLSETSNDTHSSRVLTAGGATALVTTSSNLAGVASTTTDATTETNNSTLTITGSGTSTEVQTDSQIQGTLGMVSSGSSYDTISFASTDSHSLYEADPVTTSETDTLTDSVGGITTTETIVGHATNTATTTLSGNSTDTQTATDTATLGTDGLMTSGNDTLWDTLTDGGSQTYYTASPDTLTISNTISSSVGGITTSAHGSSTETDWTTVSQFGPYSETSSETSSDTLGPDGLSTAGTDFQTAWSAGTITLSSTAPSTITSVETSTESSTLAGTHATDYSTATDTLNETSYDFGTISSTETQTATTSFGLGGLILGGSDFDSTSMVTNDSHSLHETDPGTSTESSTLTGAAGGVSTTEAVSGLVTTTPTSIIAGNSVETETMTDSEVVGANGIISSGSDSGWDTLSDSGNQTYYSATSDTLTPITTIVSTVGGVTTSATGTSTETDSVGMFQSGLYQETSSETSSDTLGSNGVILSGSDYHTAWSPTTLTLSGSQTSTITSVDTSTESSVLSGVTETTTLTSTDTLIATSADNETITATETQTSSLAFGSGNTISSGSDYDSTSLVTSGSYSLYETDPSTVNESDTLTATAGGVTSTETMTGHSTSAPTTTMADNSVETDTITDSATIGASGVISVATDTDWETLSDSSSNTLYSTGSDTLTSIDTMVSTLGGVTTNETITDHSTSAPTITMAGNSVETETISDSDVLGTNGVIGYGNGSGWDTLSDSGSQSDYSTGSDTLTAASTIVSTLGGVTTSAYGTSTETDSTTASQWGPYQETSSETSSDTLGANGVMLSGSVYQTAWSPSTLTLSETQPSTITSIETATESSALSGVSATSLLTSTDTLIGTSSDNGTITATDTQTSTLSLGYSDVISGGYEYDSLYQTGNDTPSSTVTDYGTTFTGDHSTFSNTNETTSDSDTATLHSTSTITSTGGESTTETDTVTTSLGGNAVVSSGNSSDTYSQSGWNTDTLTGASTQTETELSTLGSNDGSGLSSSHTTLTATSTLTTSESDSLTTALNDVNLTTLGANATISGGSETTTQTSSGSDTYSLYETDSDTTNLTSSSSSSMGVCDSTTTLNNTIAASPIIWSTGSGTSAASETMSETVGSGGLVSAGTLTGGDAGTVTSTYSISELSTTTENESSSETAAASAAGSADQTTLTGTLSDTTTLSSPSTLTSTDGFNETATVSDVVSGGTESSSLYETGSDSQSDTQAGTLISTQISSYDQNNAGASSSGSLTTSSTLTETARTVSGGPTTETEAETQTLGTAAIVSSGNVATTLWTNGDEYYSLYESGNETYSTGTNQAVGGGAGLVLSSGYTGTGLSTLTVTASSTFSTTETATTTLGSNAAIVGGSSNDSLYETGTDSTSSNSAGVQIHQFTDSDSNSDSGSFTLDFSSSDTDPSTFTETAIEGQTLGANGAVVSGQELDTLTSYGTGSQYFFDQGERLISIQGGTSYYNDGDYTYDENTSESYSEADYDSIGLGVNGTIAGGTENLNSTDLYTDSQSYQNVGIEVFADPVYNTPIPGTLTQTSVTTSYVYSVNQGGPSLGATGTINGGVNSFTYIQNDFDSYSTTMGDDPLYVVTESNTASYSEQMLGSESYGSGGTIAGGADSFTWTQNADDNNDFGLLYIPDTASYTTYVLNVDDYVGDALSDSGTDQLGASDSITADSDVYDIYDNHGLFNSVVDLGNAESPTYVSASGWDQVTSADIGSSTLTSGHTYATDFEGYTEFSGSTATDHETTESGSGDSVSDIYVSGNAYETYYNANENTITNNAGSMTSNSTYAMDDTHSVSGYESITGGGFEAHESGTDDAYMNAAGGSNSYGTWMSYTQLDSSGDDFLYVTGDLDDPGYTLSGVISSGSVKYSQGSQESGIEGSSSNSYVSTSTGSSDEGSGEQWYPYTFASGGTTYVTRAYVPIGYLDQSTDVLAYTVSGSPPSTTTLINSQSGSDSGSHGYDGGPGEPTSYHAVLAGAYSASRIGSYNPGAMQFGDDEQPLDTTTGLYSALGGEDVSGLEFTGNQETVVAVEGPAEIVNYGGAPGSTWQSQPTTVGYVRGNQTSGSGTSEADFNSGTPDSNPAEELENVVNFDGGGAQNTSADQPAPTSRAQQLGAMAANDNNNNSGNNNGPRDGSDINANLGGDQDNQDPSSIIDLGGNPNIVGGPFIPGSLNGPGFVAAPFMINQGNLPGDGLSGGILDDLGANPNSDIVPAADVNGLTDDERKQLWEASGGNITDEDIDGMILLGWSKFAMLGYALSLTPSNPTAGRNDDPGGPAGDQAPSSNAPPDRYPGLGKAAQLFGGIAGYLSDSGQQLVFGDFSDKKTMLGSIAQFLAGFTGADTAADARDAAAAVSDLSQDPSDPSRKRKLALSLMALAIPFLAGSWLRAGDDVAEGVAGGAKKADDAPVDSGPARDGSNIDPPGSGAPSGSGSGPLGGGPSGPSRGGQDIGQPGKAVGPDDDIPNGFSFDADNPAYRRYQVSTDQYLEYNVKGNSLEVDFITGGDAASMLKSVLDTEGPDISRISGYTTDKLGDASPEALQRFGNQVATALGPEWAASIEFEGGKRFLVFSR